MINAIGVKMEIIVLPGDMEKYFSNIKNIIINEKSELKNPQIILFFNLLVRMAAGRVFVMYQSYRPRPLVESPRTPRRQGGRPGPWPGRRGGQGAAGRGARGLRNPCPVMGPPFLRATLIKLTLISVAILFFSFSCGKRRHKCRAKNHTEVALIYSRLNKSVLPLGFRARGKSGAGGHRRTRSPGRG
jgi:hypothetical protein